MTSVMSVKLLNIM